MDILEEDAIKEGNYVIVKKQNFSKVYKVLQNGTLMLGKEEIKMNEIIGKRYWTTFEMVPLKGTKRLFTLKETQEAESWNDLKHTSSGLDNRSIFDDGTSQKLSKEEILQLQESGKSGKEIVGTLIENSKSFLAKTEYSQEKYIKKKERKYFRFVTICKPTIMSLHEIYFRQDHTRIGNLRIDTLSQLLSYSDVQSGGIHMLYDSGSQGLPAAAMLNRIGANTNGYLINLHPGNVPQLAIVQAMNFPKEQINRHVTVNIYSFLRLHYQGESSVLNDISALKKAPVDTVSVKSKNNRTLVLNTEEVTKYDESDQSDLHTQDENRGNRDISMLVEAPKIDSSVKLEHIDAMIEYKDASCEENEKKENTSIESTQSYKRKLSDSIEVVPLKKPKWLTDTQYALGLLKDVKASGLIIIAKEHPLNIVKGLLPFLGTSRPFAVFHTYREPLQETYVALKQTQNVINLRLFSNFLRSYQVLPDRTHPNILTSDTGGYILTGYLIQS